MRRAVARALVWMFVAVWMPALVGAQEAGETVTVIADPELEAGGTHRLLFGSAYRDLWTTPIEVEVLDLETEAGGLEALFQVGRLQTVGLALRGADGKSYTFRGVYKNLVRALPEELHDTPIGDIAQDLLSASVPGGGVAAIPIAVAAGVRQPIPRLVVMPDSPLLGEFREQFGGMLGTLAEFPSAAPDGGTFGATEIIDGDEVFPAMNASADLQIDDQEFLRARLVDMLLGDWDRHVGQWRFARVPGNDRLVPISEDRDQAFAQYEGIAMNMARDREPKFSDFSHEFQGLEGLGWNARSLDRRLLTGLSRQDWITMAEDVQRRLTDEVLREAIGKMPAPYVDLAGETLVEKLIARRDALVELAEEKYEFLAHEVNVFGSDGAEVIRIERLYAGSTIVTVAGRARDLDCSAEAGEIRFQRQFLPNETKSLRIYTGAGDDVVVVAGARNGGPKTHIVGGDGSNLLCDVDAETTAAFDGSSAGRKGRGVKAAPNLWLAPAEGLDTTGVPEDSQGAALNARRDWGHTSYRFPVGGFAPDVGLVVGYGAVFEKYGFRKRPFAAQHQVRGAVAFGLPSARFDYSGILRRENRRQFFIVRALASGIETLRYYGFGNETSSEGDADFFRIRQTLLGAEGRAAFWAGEHSTFTAGGIVRFTRTEDEEDDFIAVDRPYGIEDIGQLGIVAGFNFNNHTRPDGIELKGSDDALRFGPAPLGVGYTLDVDAHFYPKALGKLRDDYGVVSGDATASYLLGTRGPVFLLRVGGATTFGEVPYYDAAFLGSRELRGLRPNRYAGKHSLYGNAAAFFYLGRLNLVVPGRWGSSPVAASAACGSRARTPTSGTPATAAACGGRRGT